MSDQYDGPAMAQQILRLQAERDALKAEVAHWKANHTCEVQRARILKERPDIPIERVQAYEQWGKDQAERDALRSMLDPTQAEWHDKPPLKIARYVVAPPATGINGPSTAYVNWLEMQLFKAREVKP
jgi:crotonobetainyl-CoA:carnitine CoA-transferase CaiB-like acyl-CoA transferase